MAPPHWWPLRTETFYYSHRKGVRLNAKYIKGPDALGGAETFNFPNCEAYFIARRFGLEK